MNYNEMSADQCADWLEAKDDWIKSVVDGYATWTRKCPPEVAASPHNFRRTPPYPLTLDAAAGALAGGRLVAGWDRAGAMARGAAALASCVNYFFGKLTKALNVCAMFHLRWRGVTC